MTAVLPAVEPTIPVASSPSWAEVLRLPDSRVCAVCGHPSGEAAVCLQCAVAEETAWKRRSDW